MPTFASDVISAVFPVRAVPGGRVTLYGDNFDVTAPPAVTLGGVPARLAFTSPSKLVVLVPGDLDGGDTAIALDGVRQGARLQVGSLVATGLHQVDNPVFDRAGKFAVGGVTVTALWESLKPNYAWAQQVPKDDKRIKAEYASSNTGSKYCLRRGK